MSYGLLEIGEEVLGSDEYFYQGTWNRCRSESTLGFGFIIKDLEMPIRREFSRTCPNCGY